MDMVLSSRTGSIYSTVSHKTLDSMSIPLEKDTTVDVSGALERLDPLDLLDLRPRLVRR